MRSLQKMDDRFGMWNDVTLSALLMLGGHALEPWDDVKQGNHPAHATAFVHNDKRWYGVRMDAEDKLCKRRIMCDDVFRRWLSIVIVI